MKLYLLLFLFWQQSVLGKYLITTPQKWAAGYEAQICVTVPEQLCGSDDHLTLTIYSLNSRPRRPSFWRGRRSVNTTPIPKKVIAKDIYIETPRYGKVCTSISVPDAPTRYGQIQLKGYLGGSEVNQSRYITFALKVYETFVSTDKYLYKAGQKVKFRVLTLEGPFFKVSTKPYTSIYVETPSGGRIAQWLNVSNRDGLIHRELQLIDEPEEGTYKILVKASPTSQTVTKTFQIKDFVLPRFEVKIDTPKYLLATDKSASFKVCATYTFGQPVRGKLTGTIDNGGWRTRKVSIPINQALFGCTNLRVPLDDLKVNDRRFFVYSINLNVKFEEDGTGTVVSKSARSRITRTALTLSSLNYAPYKKAELPWINVVKATFPDGSPAVDEEFSACAGKICTTVYSDYEGLVKFSVPASLHGERRVVLSAVNYPQIFLKGEKPTTTPAPTYKSSAIRRRRRRIIRPRPYMYASKISLYASTYYSPSNSSLLILPPDSRKIECNPGGQITLDLPILFSANDTYEALLHVQVVSRGQIQDSQEVPIEFYATDLNECDLQLISPVEHNYWSYDMVTGETYVTLSIPPTMSPKLEIIVWYVRHDGEVVPDSREIDMSKCLSHQVGISWPVQKAEQGTTQQLTLSAEPYALCSLGVVDKSVELLSAGQERLTLDNIFRIANKLRPNSWEANQIDNNAYCKKFFPQPKKQPTTKPSGPRARRSFIRPPYGGYRTTAFDAIKMFDDAGLFVITDMTVETRICTKYSVPRWRRSRRGRRLARPVALPGAARRPARASARRKSRATRGRSGAQQNSVRTYFPETWLWQLTVIPENGQYQEDFKLPDTITQWVGKAVCVHPTAGVGLSATTSITTFTPFFVDLTLLPTIKQGEILPVVISVFNYLKSNLPVQVTLRPSSQYDILEGNTTFPARDQSSAGKAYLCISPGDKSTTTIRIEPLVAGEIKLVITATVDRSNTDCNKDASRLPSRSDTIKKNVRVEYEGFPRDRTFTKYVCAKDLRSGETAASWQLEAPSKDIVPGSTRAWISVVGDLLGPTLENLGNLIRLPSGCGEQNLIRFAPNIYVLQYLEASKQINKPTKDKIVRFITSGYQRQLNYKHPRGGYSAFGKRDKSGSTWLTAFVVKTFAQSRPFISVDGKELKLTTDWLKSTQNKETGCFISKGRVIHKAMKGGVNEKPVLLTAYVMAALLEAGVNAGSPAISKAINCLRGKDPEVPGRDYYEMALKAYALSLAKSTDTEGVISELLKYAKNTTGGTFWDVPNTSGRRLRRNAKVPPVAVETAAYVVLAMMNSNAVKYTSAANLIIRWISSQRNSQGGFISTQDTVVALQALAVYESYLSRSETDLTITASGSDFRKVFRITKRNKLLSQRRDVATVPSRVQFKLEGSGCALLQGVVRYNVFDARPSEALNVTVSVSRSSTNCKANTIKVCARYLLRDGRSNMAVLETKLVSGFIPDKESLKKAIRTGKGLIKRYDVNGNDVLFYVDELTPKEICVQFDAIQELYIRNRKDGTVKVYDYYEPQFQVTAKYRMPFVWCRRRRPIRPISPPRPVPLPIVRPVPLPILRPARRQ